MWNSHAPLRPPLAAASASIWRAADAVAGADSERAAIMAEGDAPKLPAEAHAATVTGLLRAASPLFGVPGAVACRRCGRGIWCSPSWAGPPPDLCLTCRKETMP